MKKRVELSGHRGPAAGMLQPLVSIEVWSRSGVYVPMRFCVDSGATQTNIPIPLALQCNIPFTRQADPDRVVGLVGSARQHRDYVRVRMFGEEFSWPCGFLETPEGAVSPDYGVLGRAGFNLAFHSCIEFPHCVIRRRTNHLPVWQRLRAFFAPFQTVAYNRPL